MTSQPHRAYNSSPPSFMPSSSLLSSSSIPLRLFFPSSSPSVSKHCCRMYFVEVGFRSNRMLYCGCLFFKFRWDDFTDSSHGRRLCQAAFFNQFELFPLHIPIAQGSWNVALFGNSCRVMYSCVECTFLCGVPAHSVAVHKLPS